MSASNTKLLTAMAAALGELRERLVFVGGCATSLLVTDRAAAPVRATQDVDAIVAVSSHSEYTALGKALEARGFTRTVTEGEPPYRWTHGTLKLDVLPTETRVLGFSNPWYALAVRTAGSVELPDGTRIRLVSPPCFIASKLVAFEDRGRSDYMESHDLEDVIAVVDGRPEIAQEMAGSEADLRRYVAAVLGALLADDGFLNALPGLVMDGTSAGRVALVLDRLRSIVEAAKN